MLKRKQGKDIAISKSANQVSDDPSTASRRLDNIRTREVSLVDEGANGKEFLIVKNKGEGMGKKTEKDKTLFKNDSPASQPVAEPASTPEGTPAPEATPADPAPAEPVASSEIAEPEVSIEKGEFSKSAENVLQEIPVAKALAMPQKEMFLAMSDALMQFSFGMDMIRADLMTFASSDGNTGFMGEEIMKSLKAQFKDGAEKDFPVFVEKAGKKMKSARLDKLKGILSSLETLIKELDESQDSEVSKGGTMTDPKKNDEVTNKSTSGSKTELEIAKEAADAANAKVAELEKSETPAEAAPATPASEEETFKKADVQSMIDSAVEKATKPLKEEIETLKEAPADSSSEEGDGTEEVNKSAEGEKKDESIFKGVIY